MNIKHIFANTTLVCIFGAASSLAFAVDKIDAEDFVEEASAKSIAEVENAKLALQKSTSLDIQNFAQQMITDHSAVNIQLTSIAGQKKLDVSDEAALTTKAKKFILEQRDGDSFDEAYTENQVEAHEDSIELFQRAAMSDDVELAKFAKQTLPKLQHHLTMAKELAAVHDKD